MLLPIKSVKKNIILFKAVTVNRWFMDHLNPQEEFDCLQKKLNINYTFCV